MYIEQVETLSTDSGLALGFLSLFRFIPLADNLMHIIFSRPRQKL